MITSQNGHLIDGQVLHLAHCSQSVEPVCNEVEGFKRSGKMRETRKSESARSELSHRDKSRDSPDRGWCNVGRDRFRLAFRTLNQAVLEQILG